MLVGGLWVVQVVVFVAGWLGPWRDAPERRTDGRLPWPVRIGLSLSLVVAAILVWQRGPAAAYAEWVAFGMVLSFVGDLIMARLLAVPNRLIGGMMAFAVAHACYISAAVHGIRAQHLAVGNLGLGVGLIIYGTSALAGWWLWIRTPRRSAALNLGALGYGMWIGVMASFMLALAVAGGGAWWLAALGGLLFVSSDFLIGITEIRGVRIHNANDWIWVTYVAAQMGLIYAAWI